MPAKKSGKKPSPPQPQPQLGEEAIRRKVKKDFDGKLFNGVVTEYDSECNWYKVLLSPYRPP